MIEYYSFLRDLKKGFQIYRYIVICWVPYYSIFFRFSNLSSPLFLNIFQIYRYMSSPLFFNIFQICSYLSCPPFFNIFQIYSYLSSPLFFNIFQIYSYLSSTLFFRFRYPSSPLFFPLKVWKHKYKERESWDYRLHLYMLFWSEECKYRS